MKEISSKIFEWEIIAIWRFSKSNFFFFSDWQPCTSDLQSGWCHRTSRLVEVFCRTPQLGRQISTMWPCQLTSLGIFWAGLKDVVWGLVSLSILTHRSVWNASPLQMGTQTTVPCAQVEDSGLLSLLQSPNWVEVCLVSTVFFLPVSIEPGVEKCLGLSVGDGVLSLRNLTAGFRKSVCSVVSCQSHMSRHPLEGYWKLSCQLGKGEVQALDNLDWVSWVGLVRLTGSRWRWWYFQFCFLLSNKCSEAVQMASISAW